MAKLSRFGSVLFAVGVLGLVAFGQSDSRAGANSAVQNSVYATALPAPTSDGGEPILTIHKRVDEVNVLFIATDRHGKFVRNLNQSDFSILDDHKPVQSISNFRRETDLPIQMGLLVDMSASVHGRFDFEKQAATGFLQHVLRAGYDKAFIVG